MSLLNKRDYMPKRLPFDFRSVAPRRSPDWRWTAAVEMHSEKKRARCWEDPAIIDAARYLRALADRGDAHAIRQWPDLHAAHLIYQGGDEWRDEMEARLITGESFEVIAAKCGIAVTTVAAFERIFFNVANLLKANDWMMIQVIKIIPGQPVTLGQAWKYLGLAGGPILLDLMIDDFLGRPDPDVALRNELAAKGRFSVSLSAVDWSCAESVHSILAEGEQLFPRLTRGALLAAQLETIRKASETTKSQPVPKSKATRIKIKHLRRARKPRKEKSHGRQKSTLTENPIAVTA